MIQKSDFFLNEKKYKNNKTSIYFQRFCKFHSVEILNSFNPGLQLKDTESSIKSKRIDLLTK